MYPHTENCGPGRAWDNPCPTVFGTRPLLTEYDGLGLWVVVATWVLIAASAGWRRVETPGTIATAIFAGPLLLAWWTTPRGDEDGLWVLIYLYLFFFTAMASLAATIAGSIALRREEPAQEPVDAGNLKEAEPGARVMAVLVDAVIVGAVVLGPTMALSRAHREVLAVVVGIALATVFLAYPLATRGSTVGQWVVGITVVDAATRRRLSFPRALARSFVVVLEAAAFPTVFLAPPAVVELVFLYTSGRTLTDRMFSTAVLGD